MLGQPRPILAHLGAILAETVFVYERSEGLPGLNDSLEVPEREESHLVPGFEASWGHLGRGPRGDQKKDPFWGWFWGRFWGQKWLSKLPKNNPKN